jgi:predicted porin
MSQSKFKKANLLAGTALVALGVALAGTASADGHAKVVKSSSDKVSLRISGQFSRSVHVIDDGVNQRVMHQDSNYSSSRFRFHANAKVNSNLKVAATLESSVDDARNTTELQSPNGGSTGNDFQTRIADIAFKHSQLGTMTMGSGNAAANGVNNANAHGVYVALTSAMALQTTATQYTNEGDNTQTGISLVGAMSDNDFNSRETRLRYDTPAMMGFKASVSHASNQSIEYALRYGGKILDSKVKAAIGLAQNTSGQANSEIVGGTISGVHSSGIGATLSCAFVNSESTAETKDDPQHCYVAGHFQRKFNEMGKTSLIVEMQQNDNQNAKGDVAKAYGVTLHQKIDAAALEVWAKYSNHELEREQSDFNDIDILSVGTRIKF